MTNIQLYLAIGIPVIVNATMFALMMAYIGARFGAVNHRFDGMRVLWLSELHRVEEVMDARLKHLEERGR